MSYLVNTINKVFFTKKFIAAGSFDIKFMLFMQIYNTKKYLTLFAAFLSVFHGQAFCCFSEEFCDTCHAKAIS